MRGSAKGIVVLLGGAGIGLVAGLGLTLLADREDPPLLARNDAETVARGHRLYDDQCAACHGGLGPDPAPPSVSNPDLVAPPHDETGHSWQHPDYALFELTRSGEVAELCLTGAEEGGMPQFGDTLDDHQILDVLAYIKSTWPKATREHQDGVNAMYAAQNDAVRRLVSDAGH